MAVRGLAFRALPLGLPRTTPWSLPLPAVIALVFDTKTGLALAVGILPVVALPLAPLRRQRILSLVIAAIAGVSLVVGSLLGSNAYVAVVGLFALCLGAGRTRTGDPEISPSVVDRV